MLTATTRSHSVSKSDTESSFQFLKFESQNLIWPFTTSTQLTYQRRSSPFDVLASTRQSAMSTSTYTRRCRLWIFQAMCNADFRVALQHPNFLVPTRAAHPSCLFASNAHDMEWTLLRQCHFVRVSPLQQCRTTSAIAPSHGEEDSPLDIVGCPTIGDNQKPYWWCYCNHMPTRARPNHPQWPPLLPTSYIPNNYRHFWLERDSNSTWVKSWECLYADHIC